MFIVGEAVVSSVNGTMYSTTTPRPRVGRFAYALAAFVALLALLAFVLGAATAGAGPVLAGVVGLAVGVALLTALPFAVVRAMAGVGFE
jgi:hypothetical protein